MASQSHLIKTEDSQSFDVFRLPIELRYKIWEELLLYEEVDKNPEWSLSEDDVISCTRIFGFFRPWAVPSSMVYHTRTWTWGDFEIQSPLLYTRTPALFLVSKVIASEAQEVAYRNVVVETCSLNKNFYLPLFARVADSLDHPMLRRMRKLFISTSSRLWSHHDKAPRRHYTKKVPQELFNDDRVPLFKLELNVDGTELTLHAQRQLNKQHADILAKEAGSWLDSQCYDTCFSSRDLWRLASMIQSLQADGRIGKWYLLPTEKDKIGQEIDALAIKQVTKPMRMSMREKLDLDSNFEATILKLTAPCARNINADKETAMAVD